MAVLLWFRQLASHFSNARTLRLFHDTHLEVYNAHAEIYGTMASEQLAIASNMTHEHQVPAIVAARTLLSIRIIPNIQPATIAPCMPNAERQLHHRLLIASVKTTTSQMLHPPELAAHFPSLPNTPQSYTIHPSKCPPSMISTAKASGISIWTT